VSVALHAGAMGIKQDLDNVVAAARLAQEGAHPVHFVLMGHGGERARLETAAKGLRTLTFLDPLPDQQYQAALAAADVLIVNEHAGLREMAVPSKLTSYFTSGRPIIAVTNRDSVTAGEINASQGGIQVQPGDPAALLTAILGLRADPQHGDHLGRNGQAYRVSVLSESAAIDRFEAWIELLGHRARRRPHSGLPAILEGVPRRYLMQRASRRRPKSSTASPRRG